MIRRSIRLASAVFPGSALACFRSASSIGPAAGTRRAAAGLVRSSSIRLPHRRSAVFPKPDPANFTAAAPTKELSMPFCRPAGATTTTASGRCRPSSRLRSKASARWSFYVGDKTGKQKPAALQFFALARRQAHHRRRRDHPLRRSSVRRISRGTAAARRRSLSRVGRQRIWNWSSSPTSSARIAKRRRPTWTSSPRTSPRRASSSRTIRSHRFIPRPMTAAAYGVCVTKLGGSTPSSSLRGRL